MGLVKEFKEFAMRGNVVDLAIGVILGAAFGKVVSSFVADVLMPPLGLMLGGVDFSSLFVPLKAADVVSLADAKAKGIPTLNYGVFLQSIVDFLIIAFAIFMLVKAINASKKKAPAPPPPGPSAEEKLLTEIRDLLKAR
jgi:large conductance mechanosensitive channel